MIWCIARTLVLLVKLLFLKLYSRTREIASRTHSRDLFCNNMHFYRRLKIVRRGVTNNNKQTEFVSGSCKEVKHCNAPSRVALVPPLLPKSYLRTNAR